MQVRAVALALLILEVTCIEQVFATSQVITLRPYSAESFPISLDSGDILEVSFNAYSSNGPEAVTFAIVHVNSFPAPNNTVFSASSVTLYSGSYTAIKTGAYSLTVSNESPNTVTVNLKYEVRTQSSATVATPQPSDRLYLFAAIVFLAGLIAFGLIWTERKKMSNKHSRSASRALTSVGSDHRRGRGMLGFVSIVRKH